MKGNEKAVDQMDKPRLIDANKAFKRYQRKLTHLIDNGECRFSYECLKIRAIMSAIENEPTAFDIDSVVEQLISASEKYESCNGDLIYDLDLDKAIEIVKGGGTDETKG